MKTSQIIRHIISGMEGDTVAEQFYDVFENGEKMEDQNSNALEDVANCLKELVDSSALSSVEEDIQFWIDELDEYLKEGSDAV